VQLDVRGTDEQPRFRQGCRRQLLSTALLLWPAAAGFHSDLRRVLMNNVFQVDPLGERTIGVLTKIDIMDKGTDCRCVLSAMQGWAGFWGKQASLATPLKQSAEEQGSGRSYRAGRAALDALPRRGWLGSRP
jgi:hypothetical protein